MAVKVTFVPEHIEPVGFAAIITLEGNGVLTVMVIAFEVTGEPVTHERFEVMTQVIISPLTSVEDVNVGFVAPEMIFPFFFH